MAVFEIPLISAPQKFTISLAGVAYNMTLRWNDLGQCWCIDIADQSNTSLVSGLPLVPGIDILEQYEYLGIGGQLVVSTDYDKLAPPTSSNLGSQSHLYFVTT
jgi:hypothetical protein